MIVEYNNKSIETLTWLEVSEQERQELQEAFFKKPEFSQVIKQFQNLKNNGVMIDKITKYYFRDLMAKVQLKGSKWTVEEVFQSKELLGIFKAKTLTNNRVFDSDNLATNIETAIRLGGHSVAAFPSNFPIKIAKEIVNKYNINNNWYDFSCGWGVRLLTALIQGINYYGTDPNYLLTERLFQLTSDYKKLFDIQNTIDIRTQGSEIFIPEWENIIGLAFSSPPYFDLEDYTIGKQSYNKNISYDQWKNNYLIPTISNIYKYLINDGILAFNIKNGKTYKLADDTKMIAIDSGFELIDTEWLVNNKRITPSGLINNGEDIFIFKKKNNKEKLIIPEFQIETSNDIQTINNQLNLSTKNETQKISKQLDIYLIGVKSKKQLNDKDIYNSDNIFLGERYFSTFYNDILSSVQFLINYELGKYIEVTKQHIIELLYYASFHRDCNNSFKTVNKLCEIIDTWDDMEANNFHLFLQIENN